MHDFILPKCQSSRFDLCSCAGFLLSACPSSPLSNSFFICSLEVGFLPFLGSSTPPAMLPVFLRSFANALLLYFASVKAGSDITENGLFDRQRAKETINGGSQIYFTDELL